MRIWGSESWGAGLVLGAMAVGCSVTPSNDETTFQNPTTSIGPDDTGRTEGPATDTGATTEDSLDEDTGIKLDTPDTPGDGCQYVDFLFVIDNSASMATYQMALTEQFPDFITAMYDALPPNIDVHVGLTTTDFDDGCDAQEATNNCQTNAPLDEVESHYRKPDEDPDGGNGTQGRLFEWAGQTYFQSNSNDDPAALSAWFSDAAVAAGEEGCSFEMPVAAAAYATNLVNAPTNDGFLRDESGLFIVFFLTDEPDKSPESAMNVYRPMVLDAKAGCGGEVCVFVSGLVPTCLQDVNQKLWQFMNMFSENEPIWGDIEATDQYSAVFGDALAGAIAEACANVPIP